MLLIENLMLIAVSIPNPAPANDPDIASKARSVIALIKLVGLLGGSASALAGAALLWAGNRGGNHGFSVTGKGLLLSGFATLLAIPLVIPVINRWFV